MGFLNFFGKKKETLEDANRLNEEFIQKNPVANNEEDELLRKASAFMTSGRFRESLDVYLVLSERFSQRSEVYLSQVGANYYFLGEYETALGYYIAARSKGMDASMMDDNIWEALETLYYNTKDKNYLRRYLELCPDGAYVKKVNKLI